MMTCRTTPSTAPGTSDVSVAASEVSALRVGMTTVIMARDLMPADAERQHGQRHKIVHRFDA